MRKDCDIDTLTLCCANGSSKSTVALFLASSRCPLDGALTDVRSRGSVGPVASGDGVAEEWVLDGECKEVAKRDEDVGVEGDLMNIDLVPSTRRPPSGGSSALGRLVGSGCGAGLGGPTTVVGAPGGLREGFVGPSTIGGAVFGGN
jgi:hypothetical protein